MASVGFQKLAEPRARNVRKLRMWAGCFALLVALGLSMLAGRPPAERSPFEVYNFAAKPLEPVEGDYKTREVVAASPIILRPAIDPKARNIPTTRFRSRNAGLFKRAAK